MERAGPAGASSGSGPDRVPAENVETCPEVNRSVTTAQNGRRSHFSETQRPPPPRFGARKPGVKKCPLCVVVVPNLAINCPRCHGRLIEVKPLENRGHQPSPWLLLTVVGLLLFAWTIWRRASHV